MWESENTKFVMKIIAFATVIRSFDTRLMNPFPLC